jgi:predicted metal-dependent peptidase
VDVLSRIVNAKVALVCDHRFFGQLCTRMDSREVSFIPTCATDGANFLFNRLYVNRLTDPQLIGVVCHEILHCALGHLWRIGDRDPVKWNVAADAIINPIVIDCRMELPPNVVMPDTLNKQYGINIEAGMNVEHVYNLLPDAVSDDYAHIGGMLPASSKVGNSQAEWARAAAQSAKAAGTLPGSLTEIIDDLADPKVNWRAALQLLLQRCLLHEDYTMRFPNRRYTGLDLYLPSLFSERAPEVSLYCDTSGSCWTEEILREFGGEVTGVLNQCRPRKLYLDYFDTEVKEGEMFEPGDQVVIRPKGSGGTDFQCIFDHIRETQRNPAAAVILTDGYGLGWPKQPHFPVIWAINSRVIAPWGQTIDIREGV